MVWKRDARFVLAELFYETSCRDDRVETWIREYNPSNMMLLVFADLAAGGKGPYPLAHRKGSFYPSGVVLRWPERSPGPTATLSIESRMESAGRPSLNLIGEARGGSGEPFLRSIARKVFRFVERHLTRR